MTGEKLTQPTNKKKTFFLVALAVGVVVLILVGAGAFAKKKIFNKPAQAPVPTPTKKVLEPVNVIDLKERPFISLKPKADGHNLLINVNNLPLPAEKMEYELEYQTGSMLQGAFGEVELSNLPLTEEVFLGSCSAGGACTYHKDIKGGSLLTRYSGGENHYALKSDFRWWEKDRDSNQFASRDAKFKLVSDDLAKNAYVIVFNGAGLPDIDKLEGEVMSDIYVIGASGKLSGKVETLSLRAKDDQATHIAYWTETGGWQYLQANVGDDPKTLVVENLPLASVYVAVKYTDYE